VSDMFKVAAGNAWRISSRRFAVDKSTQGPSGHYTNITLTGSDRDAGVVNAGSVHRMQACSTERKEVCMPRTPPSATVRFLACVATVRGSGQRLTCSRRPAGRPEQSLSFLGAGAGRLGEGRGGTEKGCCRARALFRQFSSVPVHSLFL
jgi:hypothetical protein